MWEAHLRSQTRCRRHSRQETTTPKDLVRLCALTWACASPPLSNSHPNEDGYEVIAEAIADAVRT